MKAVHTDQAPAAVGPYEQAIQLDSFLFASGQIPLNPETGALAGPSMDEQAQQVMENIAAVLESAGMGFEHVVKTTCFLTDMNDFVPFNEVYARYFTGKPARSCVSVRELPKGARCEVEFIAHK